MSSNDTDKVSTYDPMFSLNEPVEITNGRYARHRGIILKIALRYHVLLENGIHVIKAEKELKRFD